MKIAYFDCSSGISGDMCLGALVNAGVPLRRIERGLKALSIKGYRLEAKKVKRAGIAAVKVDVLLQKSQVKNKESARTWQDIEKIIRKSSFSHDIKQKGLNVFRRLFEAEGKVHGSTYRKTHLHELGAVDCVVDVFGTLIGLDILGVDIIYSSAVNVGSGAVKTEHGRLPVPAPATAQILKGVPVYASDIPFELTTPTGAAILKELTDKFVTLPLMKIRQIGYGAGQREIKGLPNALRIIVGDVISQGYSKPFPVITVIETNIDDMNPQIYEYVMERLFDAGALDVYLNQVIMKKSRPGVVLTVLCEENKKTEILNILFRETTTTGVRFHEMSRAVLERKSKEMATVFGRQKIKISKMTDGAVKFLPEYEYCKRAARKHNIPLFEVMRLVMTKKHVRWPG